MLKHFLFLLCLFVWSHQKIYNNRFSISEVRRSKGWIFLDRMSFGEGPALVKCVVKIETPTETQKQLITIDLVLVPDNLWLRQHSFQCNQQEKLDNEIVLPIQIKRSQGYIGQTTTHLTLKQSTNYHFVIKDCQKQLVNEYLRKQSKLNVYLQMKNGDYDHGDDEHVTKFMLPFLLILTAIMGYISKGPKHMQVGQERDWAKLILFITLAFNFIALFFNYWGFLVYLWKGQNYGFFDFMYLLFHSISESVLTSLLIFIAYGWTLTFTKDAEFDLYVPLISMLGLINLILTLLGKINDGDSDKYHMYDTIPSYLLVFFRIVTVIVFAIGIVKIFLENRKNAGLISFLANFAFMGGIYFLSLPAIMLIATVLPAYTRKQIVFFSVELIKNGVNLILTYMISSKKSKYKKIQHTGQSFFQSENNKLL